MSRRSANGATTNTGEMTCRMRVQRSRGACHGSGEPRSPANRVRPAAKGIQSSPVRAVVLLPTYDERDNIVSMLEALRSSAPDADIVVIDDDSPDGTGILADEAAERLGSITVLHRTGKSGLGSAYRAGFAIAAADGYDAIVTMDCDFSHDPAVVPSMIARLEAGADVAVGSRYVSGGGVVDWPLRRRLLSRWGNRYTAAALRLDVRDCTLGFRAYRTAALRRAQPEATTAEGYAFLTELLRRLRASEASIVEVPITFRERRAGNSKMSGRIIVESMSLVTRWGLADRWSAIAHRHRR